MLVRDFLELATDCQAMVQCDIFNEDGSLCTDVVTMDDAIDKYGDYEVLSFDSYIENNILCLNVEYFKNWLECIEYDLQEEQEQEQAENIAHNQMLDNIIKQLKLKYEIVSEFVQDRLLELQKEQA